MPIDQKTFAASAPINGAAEATAVVPADADLEQFTRALYVGVSGDVTVVMAGKRNTITFVGVGAGSILPVRVAQVTSATTASSILALY